MTNIGPGRAAPISNRLWPRARICFSRAPMPIYWQVRPETDRRGRADRHLAIYKEKARELDPVLLDNDPSNDHLATTQWRLPPVSRPEDKLIGVCYLMDPVDGDIVVSDASHWAFANTGLVNGSALAGLLGYEVDGLLRNAPDGLRVLAASPAKNLKSQAELLSRTWRPMSPRRAPKSSPREAFSGVGDWTTSMRRVFARHG